MKNLTISLTEMDTENQNVVNKITKSVISGNVTNLEYSVLRHLICENPLDTWSCDSYEDLCIFLSMDMKTLKGVVGSLVKKRLVTSHCTDDGSRHFVSLEYYNDKDPLDESLEYLREWITEYEK